MKLYVYCISSQRQNLDSDSGTFSRKHNFLVFCWNAADDRRGESSAGGVSQSDYTNLKTRIRVCVTGLLHILYIILMLCYMTHRSVITCFCGISQIVQFYFQRLQALLGVAVSL